MGCFRPLLVRGEYVRPGPSASEISSYQGTTSPRSQAESSRSERKRDTDIWERRWDWGKCINIIYTLLKRKKKSGCVTTKVIVHLLCVCVLVAQLCPPLCDPMVCPWGSLGKNTGVGSYSLLQGIFPALGSNLGFLNCRQTFCRLRYTARLLFEESLVSSCQVLNKAGERERKGFFTFYFIYQRFLYFSFS